MFEKVLVPTDFSKHAKKVIECVGEIPGIKQVVLLSVISRSAITRVWDPVAELKEVEARLMKEKKLIKAPGIEVKVRAVSVLEGEIGNAVQRVAEEEKASLVAMGARGRSRIKSALLGSVSRHALRFGDTHLLILRSKTHDGGAPEESCQRV